MRELTDWTFETTEGLTLYIKSDEEMINKRLFSISISSVIKTFEQLLRTPIEVINGKVIRKQIISAVNLFLGPTNEKQGNDLDQQRFAKAFDLFCDNLEPFAKMALFHAKLVNRNWIEQSKNSLGATNERLMQAITIQCRLPMNTLNILKGYLLAGEQWRNNWHHNAKPSGLDERKAGCRIALRYCFAISAICYKISIAKGGIRFTTDYPCDLVFIHKEKKRRIPFNGLVAGQTLQIDSAPGHYSLEICVTSENSARHILTRSGEIKEQQYIEENFVVAEQNDLMNQIANQYNPFFIEEDDVEEGINYQGGLYTGAINSKGLPEGIGCLKIKDILFIGTFKQGLPIGQFQVEGPNFHYAGTISAQQHLWDLQQGELEQIITDTQGKSHSYFYEGSFREYSCVSGKFSIDGKLVYEGTFALKSHRAIAEGKGILYLLDGSIYIGELVNGRPHGRGCQLNATQTEALYANWAKGKPLGCASSFTKITVSGDNLAWLYDGHQKLCHLQGTPLLLKTNFKELSLNVKSEDEQRVAYLFETYDEIEYFFADKDILTYIGAFSYSDELLTTNQINGKTGFIVKTTKKQIIPCQYEEAMDFSEGLAAVKVNNLWGFINKHGELVIQCQSGIGSHFSEGLAPISRTDCVGFIDQRGELVIPCIYEATGLFCEGLAPVQLDGKWGFINPVGQTIIPFVFDDARGFHEGKAKVIYQGKRILIDKQWRPTT